MAKGAPAGRPRSVGAQPGGRFGIPAPALVPVVALALTVPVGIVLTIVLEPRAFGSWLGAPLPPLFVVWSPTFGPMAAAAVVLVPGAAVAAPLLGSSRVGPRAFAAGALLLAVALRLGLAAARGGVAAWSAPFADGVRGGNEYLPALPGIEGLGLAGYLDRFAEIMPSLPVHPSAHPPGTIVLLHLLGLDGAGRMAALTIGVGALAVPLAYALGRVLLGEREARVAALLLAFCPAAVIYGATSADALYATLGLAAAIPLAARGRLTRPVGAVALAVASFFSWALLAVGAWAAVLAWARDGLRSALRLSLVCAAVLAAAYSLLYAATGYDPLAVLSTAGELYRLGVSGERPYWYWVLGSPAAFAIAIGLPLAWFAIKGVGERRAPAVALAAIVLVAAILGFSKAETERIWLFMAPLACVAAAPTIDGRRLRIVLVALAIQALAVELLFYTLW